MHEEEPVHVEPTGSSLVAGARRVVEPSAITSNLESMIESAMAILHQARIPPAGPPIVKAVDLENGKIELHVGFVVNAKDPALSLLPTFTLPAGEVASTWHVGPRETIRHAYQRLERWLLARGKLPSSTRPWEVLWAGWSGTSAPGHRSRIQVMWPVENA